MSALEVESLLQKMAALRDTNGDWPRGAGIEFHELYTVLEKIYAKILRAEPLVVDRRTSAVYSVFIDDLRLVVFSVDDALHKFSSGTSFSSFAKRSLYHKLRGGAGGSRKPWPVPVVLVAWHPAFLMAPGLTDRIHMLHDAIVSDAAQPKTEDIEHAFENFFSSRVIRRMIIDCPAFAVILWRKALEGKCKIWAEGHSSKVVAGFLESPSKEVQDLAKPELQPLVDAGILKVPDPKVVQK